METAAHRPPIKKDRLAVFVACVGVEVEVGGFTFGVFRHNCPRGLVEDCGLAEALAEPLGEGSGKAEVAGIGVAVGFVGEGVGDFDGVVGHWCVPLSFDGLSIAQAQTFVKYFRKKLRK